MLRRKSKAQSTAEYAIVIGLVIAAAVAMQIYVKRGLQAKVKGAVDFNDPESRGILGRAATGNQFEPDYLTSTGGMRTTSETKEKITTAEGGGVTRDIVGTDTSSRTGTQVISAEPNVTSNVTSNGASNGASGF